MEDAFTGRGDRVIGGSAWLLLCSGFIRFRVGRDVKGRRWKQGLGRGLSILLVSMLIQLAASACGGGDVAGPSPGENVRDASVLSNVEEAGTPAVNGGDVAERDVLATAFVEPTRTPVPTSTATPVVTAAPAPTPESVQTPVPAPRSTATPVATVAPAPTPESVQTPVPAPRSTATPVATVAPAPTPESVQTPVPAPRSTATPVATVAPKPNSEPTRAPVVTKAPPAAFVSAVAGRYDTCGVRTDGTIRCWGDRFTGEYAPPAGEFASVSVGVWEVCALTAGGRLYCLKGGEEIRLAQGERFSSVSVGKDHTCGVTLNGSVSCWGEDDYGQASSPKGNFASVSVGDEHTCGLAVDGSIVCWGSNYDGQSTPPAGRYSAVSAGDKDTCGIKVDGAIECWGRNHGRRDHTPPGGTYQAVGLGRTHACALAVDGFVICWGRNDDGRATAPNGEFASLSVGLEHSCAVTNDGAAVCWGDNSWGQVASDTICSAIAAGEVDAVTQSLGGITADCAGDSFLYTAVVNRQLEVVRVLLDSGEDPNGTGGYGNPVLRTAVGWGLTEIARELINAGADVNAVDTWGEPLLYIAVEDAEPGIVRLLLEAGADPNAKDRSGMSALALAHDPENYNSSSREAAAEIVGILLNGGAVPDFAPPVPRVWVVGRSERSITLEFSRSEVETHFQGRRRNVNGSGGWRSIETPNADSRFEDKGLTPDTVYEYEIKACNTAGCSVASGRTSGVTEVSGPVGIPSAPTLSGSRVGDRILAALNWNSVAGATYYEIYQDEALERIVSAPQTDLADYPNSSYHWPSGSSFSRTDYTVRACNKAGCSAHSNRVRLP